MKGILAALFFPLVNLATHTLKTIAPQIPPALLPLVNLGLGIAIAALAGYLGLDPGGAIAADPTHGLLVGTAIAGSATIAHNVAKHATQ